jgi:hypothetical protein
VGVSVAKFDYGNFALENSFHTSSSILNELLVLLFSLMILELSLAVKTVVLLDGNLLQR